MNNLFGNTDPKQRLLEYNRWNSGDKLLEDGLKTSSDILSSWHDIFPKEETKSTKIPESINTLKVGENDKKYLYVLAKRESGFNPKSVGATGTYKGLYQFGPSALKEVGLTEDEYMGDINNQHYAALKLKEINLNRLNPYKKYINKIVNGVKITENGLAAAAHLLGVGGVKAFFNEGIINKDGLGTPITEYFNLFT